MTPATHVEGLAVVVPSPLHVFPYKGESQKVLGDLMVVPVVVTMMLGDKLCLEQHAHTTDDGSPV